MMSTNSCKIINACVIAVYLHTYVRMQEMHFNKGITLNHCRPDVAEPLYQSLQMFPIYAKQKHPRCKIVQGQLEAALPMCDQKL